jgi:hypothetical protein
VPGCELELIHEKTYYKRYRICVNHCNIAAMTLEGQRQRFCQQCGRFHVLAEFDGVRKSCRRKLKRHNERRRAAPAKGRKWQACSDAEEEVDSDADANAVANIQRAATRSRPARASSHAAAGVPPPALSGDIVKPFGLGAALPPSPPMLYSSLTDRLLSAARSLVGRPAAPPAAASPAFSGASGSRAGGSGSGVPTPVPSPPRPTAASAAALQALCADVRLMELPPFDHGQGDGYLLLNEDPSDSLVLSATAASGAAPDGGSAASVQALDLLAASFVDELPMLPLPGEMEAASAAAAPGRQALAAAAGLLLGAGGGPPLGYTYTPHDQVTRLSLKVFNCTPDLLLPAVRTELEALVRTPHSLLEGCIRPGCVHLTLSALSPLPPGGGGPSGGSGGGGGGGGGGGLAGAVERLLRRDALGPAASESMVVQSGHEIVVVKRRRVVAVIDTAQSAALLPRLAAVRPLVVAAAPRQGVLLAGQRIAGDADVVLCRQAGRNLTVELAAGAALGGGSSLEVVQACVLGLSPGLAEVEVQRGAFLGKSRPLLVLPPGQDAAAAELRQLEALCGAGGDVDALLRDAGVVVQWLQRGAAAAAGRAGPAYTPLLLARVQGMACRLAACAAARGWPATAALLLPAATAAGQSGAEAVAAMGAACPPSASVLHVAVGSGRAEVVEALEAWARAAGGGAALALAVDGRGPAGVTPLHVAALLPRPQRAAMLRALGSLSSAVGKLWGLARADDGTTPEALADADAATATATGTGTISAIKRAAAKRAAVECEQVEATASQASAAAGTRSKGASKAGGEGEHASSWSPVARAPAPLVAAQLRKRRVQAKRQLDDAHINALLREVAGVRRPSARTDLMGAALAAGAGVAAVVMHMLSAAAL